MSTTTDEQPTLDETTEPAVTPDPLPEPDPLPGATPRKRGRPRGSATSTPRAPRRAPAKAKVDIRARLTELYAGAGMAIAMVPTPPSVTNPELSVSQVAGMAVAAQADACGEAWAKLAEDNPAVKATLERILAVSAVGVLLSAHAPIALTVAAAVGALPPSIAAALGGAAPKTDEG